MPSSNLRIRILVTAVILAVPTVGATVPGHARSLPECDGAPATIIGTQGPDSIDGTPGNDVIVGLAGNDVINGLTGDDLICGGSGNDVVKGGPGTDGLQGGSGNDTLWCGPGFDDGGLGGGSGDDTLHGKSLCSNALYPGSGDDLVVGGTNQWDAVFYEDAAGPIHANLATGIATGQGTDTLVGIDALFGGPFDDTLVGSDTNDWLVGGPGDDTLIGHGGPDTLSGEQGDDVYRGGSGFDVAEYFDDAAAGGRVIGPMNVNLRTGIATGDGTDSLSGIEGATGSEKADTMIGDGKGNAFFFLFGGDDTVIGGGGDDFVAPGVGANTLSGGAGEDLLWYVGGQDFEHDHPAVTVDLDAGTSSSGDSLNGFEDVFGSVYDDMLIGDGGPNRLFGNRGDDVLKGRGGNDHLIGLGGADEAIGGVGVDRCWAEVRHTCEFGGGGASVHAAALIRHQLKATSELMNTTEGINSLMKNAEGRRRGRMYVVP